MRACVLCRALTSKSTEERGSVTDSTLTSTLTPCDFTTNNVKLSSLFFVSVAVRG